MKNEKHVRRIVDGAIVTTKKELMPADVAKQIYAIKDKKTKRASYDWWRLYRLAPKEYFSMFDEQGGRCSICGSSREELSKSLCIDHDHETGKVRGLLCHRCNQLIANARERADILTNAIDYLRKHNRKNSELCATK